MLLQDSSFPQVLSLLWSFLHTSFVSCVSIFIHSGLRNCWIYVITTVHPASSHGEVSSTIMTVLVLEDQKTTSRWILVAMTSWGNISCRSGSALVFQRRSGELQRRLVSSKPKVIFSPVLINLLQTFPIIIILWKQFLFLLLIIFFNHYNYVSSTNPLPQPSDMVSPSPCFTDVDVSSTSKDTFANCSWKVRFFSDLRLQTGLWRKRAGRKAFLLALFSFKVLLELCRRYRWPLYHHWSITATEILTKYTQTLHTYAHFWNTNPTDQSIGPLRWLLICFLICIMFTVWL